LLRSHVVLRAQVTLKRLELLAVFQADQVIERLTGTAGFGGSAGGATWPPETRSSAECT
jgi:hypothetical protein